jgi:short-subunit dehydrogenase
MQATNGGHLVAIPGVLGRTPLAGGAAYCAAKYGLSGLFKAMALDLRRANIACSLLYLGGVDTSFWDTLSLRVQRDKLLTADDAARAIVYALGQSRPGIVAEIALQPESHLVL